MTARRAAPEIEHQRPASLSGHAPQRWPGSCYLPYGMRTPAISIALLLLFAVRPTLAAEPQEEPSVTGLPGRTATPSAQPLAVPARSIATPTGLIVNLPLLAVRF